MFSLTLSKISSFSSVSRSCLKSAFLSGTGFTSSMLWFDWLSFGVFADGDSLMKLFGRLLVSLGE